MTIELLDTESDETEKSVNCAQEWSTYVEKYTGQNNGPSSSDQLLDNKESSPMDMSSSEAGGSTTGNKSSNSEGGAVAGKEMPGKKSKTHGSGANEDAVSSSKSTTTALTSLSSGAPSLSINDISHNNHSSSSSSSSGGRAFHSVQSNSFPVVGSDDNRSSGNSGIGDILSDSKAECGTGAFAGPTTMMRSGVGSTSSPSVLMKHNSNKCNKTKISLFDPLNHRSTETSIKIEKTVGEDN